MPCQGPSAAEQRTVEKQTKLFKLVLSVNERYKKLNEGVGFLRDDLYLILKLAVDWPWQWQDKGNVHGLSGRKLFDVATEALCTFTEGMSADESNVLMYNGRDKKARRYADWWDAHQKLDRQRRRDAAERTARMEAQREADAFFEQVYNKKMAEFDATT